MSDWEPKAKVNFVPLVICPDPGCDAEVFVPVDLERGRWAMECHCHDCGLKIEVLYD